MISISADDYNKGLDLLNRGDYTESIKCFNKVLDQDPNNIDAFYQKSQALGNIGKYNQQLNSLESILSIDPENKNALMGKSSYYHDFAKYDSELEILEQILNIYHNDPEALFNKAIALSYIHKENFEKFYSNDIIDEETVTILNIKGWVEFNLGKFDNALYYFKKSLELEKNVDNYHIIAYICHEKGDIDKTQQYLDKCLNINPNYIPALLLLSLLQETPQKSEIYIDKVLEINPNHFTALTCKVWLILDEDKSKLIWKEYKEAETYIDLALKLIPEDPDMLKLKAACLCFFGKYDQSCDYYKKALSINPFDENLYTGAAITLSSKTNYQKALDYCDKAEELNPDYKLPIYYKGLIMSLMGEYNRAIEFYDEYLRLEKNDISTLLLKSESLVYLKNYNEALNIVEKAISLDPKRVGSWITKGKIYHYYLNNLSEAVKLYKYALENAEEDPEIYYYLKNALKSMGNLDESRYYEQKLFESDIIALEKQLEDKLVKDLNVFGEFGFKLKLLKRQYQCKNSDGYKRRIDLLCENIEGKTVVIELKVVMAGIETYYQIKEYMDLMNSDNGQKGVLGIVISDGADEEFLEMISKEEYLYQFNISDLGFETMF